MTNVRIEPASIFLNEKSLDGFKRMQQIGTFTLPRAYIFSSTPNALPYSKSKWYKSKIQVALDLPLAFWPTLPHKSNLFHNLDFWELFSHLRTLLHTFCF